MTDPAETATAAALPRRASEAERFTWTAVRDLAGATGGQLASRPGVRGDPPAPPADGCDPRTGLSCARAVEITALGIARGYIRAARADGMSWHEIGAELGLSASGESGETVADAAFDYAAGPAGSGEALVYGRSVSWKCPACTAVIEDRGPALVAGPRDSETGHSDDCGRQ